MNRFSHGAPPVIVQLDTIPEIRNWAAESPWTWNLLWDERAEVAQQYLL